MKIENPMKENKEKTLKNKKGLYETECENWECNWKGKGKDPICSP